VKISIRIVDRLRNTTCLAIHLQSRLVHDQEINLSSFEYFPYCIPCKLEQFTVGLCLQYQLHLRNSLSKLAWIDASPLKVSLLN